MADRIPLAEQGITLPKLTDRSKGELGFIDQMTRKKMVHWGEEVIYYGQVVELVKDQPYLDHALNKGWLTKKEPRTLTASGWQTATAFLKR